MGGIPSDQRPRLKPNNRMIDGKLKSNFAGRQPFCPTDEQRRAVMLMVSAGLTKKAIANLIYNPTTRTPISYPVLEKYFGYELANGKDWTDAKVHAALVSKAIGFQFRLDDEGNPIEVPYKNGPDVTAIKWYEQSRRGFKEGVQLEHSGEITNVEREVVVLIPQNGREQNLDQFRMAPCIEHEPLKKDVDEPEVWIPSNGREME